MPNIDDKVVAMSFESSKFESGVNKSLNSIEKLKSALKFKDSGKGLQAFGAAANRLNLGRISHGIQEISNKLNAFRLVAVAVFADVVRRGIRAGTQLVKAFTIDPMKAGFKEYTTNLNSVQTILANTQASGATLKDVNAALDELNDYSDKTIYNFGQMARNIGTFTAAGVDLKTATASIKGIANLAALSGSNAQQASTAMYQLSQAISAGSVKLMDWNSVVNAGMGGTVFQRALAQTGEHMGALKKGTVELVGPMKNVKIAGESFRNSLSAPGKDGWLTSEILTKTLKTFTGDMTDAELAAEGWNKKQIKAIQAQAKAAMLAATNVKTLDQVLAVAKETAGSGWAKTWRIIFGDFTEAKKTFTNLSNTINGMIIDSARARNNMLGDWKALGGRKVLIEGIKEAFHNLSEVLKPIKAAFREFFPRTTGKQLFDLTVRFKEFTEMLKPSPETLRNLYHTFRGLFSILDIGKEIVFGLFGVFKKLIGATGAGSGGFLSFTAAVGDALIKFHDWLIDGGKLAAFFDKLGNVLAAPIDLLKALGKALKDAFSGISLGGIGGGIDGITEKLSPLQRIMEGIAKAWNLLLDGIGNSGKILKPVIDAFVQGFQALGPAINNALSSMNFQAILAVVRTGLLAGLVLLFKKFLGGGSAIEQITKGFGEGILGNISGSFQALQGNLVAMQNNVKADTLKKIATAVALLAISVLAISMVDPKRLSSSLGAMTVMFGQLLASMAIMEKISTSSGFLKMPIITFSLLGLAIAIDTLAIAVLALSRLSWNELLKGLAGIAVSMGVLVAAVGPLSSGSPGMIRAAVAMMAMAVALRILASAVKAMGEMDLATLGKGLGSVAIGLRFITGAMNSMPVKGMAAAGLSIVLIAVGLRILGEAVQKFGEMSISTLAKGLLSVSVALQFIAAAMHMMPKGMALQAAGLLLVAVALQGIARAVGIMGGMSLSELAKGIGALAVTLALLGLALIVMEGSIGGAVALGVAAGGIILLASALKTMGGMSWMEIVKAMVALSAAFAIIGVAALLITPAIPGLLGFGVAIALIGIGLAATGAALFLVAAGLSALVVAAPTGFGVLLAAITEFQKGLIENIKLFVLGILKIVQELARTAPQFVDAIVKILNSLIDGLIQIVPKLVPLVATLITALIDILDQNQDRLIQAGYNFLISFLQGLRNNISELTKVVVQIIAEFINGIAKNIRKIVDSGVKLVTSFLKAIASGYSGIAKAAISIITKFIGAIASNIGKVATAGLSIITKLLSAIAKGLGKVIKAGTDVVVSFINGVGNAGPRIVTAATNAIIKFINALGQNGVKLARAGLQAIVNFLNGVAKAIEDKDQDIRQAGIRIGKAVVNGMIGGITAMLPDLLRKAGDMVKSVKDKLEFWHSPPSAYGKKLGQDVVMGLANGLSDNAEAIDAAAGMSRGIIDKTKDIFQVASASKVMFAIGRDVIRGFAGGLKAGTQEDIKSAFGDLSQKLATQMSDLKSKIKEENKKLKELNKGKETKEENDQIAALNKTLKDHYKRLNAITNAQRLLNGGIKVTNAGLKESKNTLLKYAKQVEKLNEQIEVAKDLFEGFKAQFTDLPDFVFEDENGNPVEDQLGAYGTALGKQADATEKFASTMETLKGLGLDDQTYQALLEAGPAAQQFIDQLIAGGKPAVDAINAMDIRISNAATTLANSAAEKLYKAGEKAAEGFVTGLETQKEAIEKIMDDIVDKMVKRLRHKLRIHSPSEIFAEIGTLTMEGMAKGLENSTGLVTDAVDSVGQDAITAMQQSMLGISNAVTDELDVNPTITPVLDLTQVKSKAAELAALTGSATTASVLASSISKDQSAQAEMVATAGGTSVKFEQNNYSPEALSDIEIYRQTKNQLSMLKSSLALT